MLVVTELAEAAEAYRLPDSDIRVTTIGEGGKPEGFPSELADVVIRVFDTAESLGIDIASEIERKMTFNATRSYRHGGKRA